MWAGFRAAVWRGVSSVRPRGMETLLTTMRGIATKIYTTYGKLPSVEELEDVIEGLRSEIRELLTLRVERRVWH